MGDSSVSSTHNEHYMKLLIYVLGIAVTIIIGGGGSWMSSISSEVKAIGDLQRDRGERVSIVEARVNQQSIELDRINAKLDKIWEKVK